MTTPEKNITTIKKEDVAIRAEIERVKALNRNHRLWTSDPDGVDALYINDPVTKLKGVSEKKEELLAQNELKTVQDLIDLGMDDAAFKSIIKKTKGLGKKSLQSFVDEAANTLRGSSPVLDYYIDACNPYRAKYGEEKDEVGRRGMKSPGTKKRDILRNCFHH